MKLLGFVFPFVALLVAIFNMQFQLLLLAVFGMSAVTVYWMPLVVVVVLLLFFGLFISKSNFSKSIKIVLISTFSLSLVIGVSILNPYAEGFTESEVYAIENTTEYLPLLDSVAPSEANLYCFLLVDCPHCQEAARFINAMSKSGDYPTTIFVYHAYKQTADSIAKANQIVVDYTYIDNDDFFRLSGSHFPFVLLRTNADSLLFWSGADVNRGALDAIRAKVK